jgi:hypothetical protein
VSLRYLEMNQDGVLLLNLGDDGKPRARYEYVQHTSAIYVPQQGSCF